MDESEKLVEIYLRYIGFTDVCFEPDGNIPPDFLADGRVAIEVRRLNQNYDDGSGNGPRGLEEATIPLWQKVRSYLLDLGDAPEGGQSWFVFYRFSRPVPKWRDLKKDLDSVLKPFMSDASPQPFDADLGAGFSIRVFRAMEPHTTFFVPAGHSDHQSGGWLLEQIEKNLNHCISEKTGKIEPYRSKYPEWWLVLPDHIGLGLGEFEQELFRDKVSVVSSSFDKVVLIDPRNAARFFQAYPPTSS